MEAIPTRPSLLNRTVNYLGVDPESFANTVQQYGGSPPAYAIKYLMEPTPAPETFEQGAQYITQGMKSGGAFLPGGSGLAIPMITKEQFIEQGSKLIPDSWYHRLMGLYDPRRPSTQIAGLAQRIPVETLENLQQIRELTKQTYTDVMKEKYRSYIRGIYNPLSKGQYEVLLKQGADVTDLAHESVGHALDYLKYITKEEKSDIMVWYSNFATKSPRKLDRLINTLNTNFPNASEMFAEAMGRYALKDNKFNLFPTEIKDLVRKAYSRAWGE